MTALAPPAGAVTLLFAVDGATDTPCAAGGAASVAAAAACDAAAAAPRDACAPPASSSGGERTLYTRQSLASTLCLMGAKPRHSLKVSARVFDALGVLSRRTQPGGAGGAGSRALPHRLPRPVVRTATFAGAAASLPRPHFEALVAWALAEYQYAKPDQLDDLRLACRVHERRAAVIILLCGTSGTGKSTLAALLAARMGITTVISTDAVRSVMRGMVSESDNPLLFASTYQAGDFVAYTGEPDAEPAVVARKRTVKGYKAQSELVMAHLARMVEGCAARGESAVVEGVHLNLRLLAPLMARHAAVLPFLITISNETKHRERFAVRAKYMSLSPDTNRYIAYFRPIRAIQDYLAVRSARFLVPRVNNTNVDRSVNTIAATAFGCLRRGGEWDADAPGALLLDEYRRHTLARGAWSSKSMLALIRGRHERERAAAAAADARSTSSSAITGVSSEEEREDEAALAPAPRARCCSAGDGASAAASASSDDDYSAAVVAAATDSEAGFHSEVGSILDSQLSEEEGDGAGADAALAHRFSRLATLAEM